MYKQSSNKRNYSTTPIVKVTEEGKEEIVCIVTLPKKDGEVLAQTIIDLLNFNEQIIIEKEYEDARYEAINNYVIKNGLTRK